ncbi:MAG: rod shape-determining protein MreD [Treponema sp.]|nr:rod shape-determining protein MreD [Treponema sp.]
MIRSLIASTICLLVFALFETAILSNMLVLPAVPDFLLLIVVYMAVQNGRLFGASAGFISGLLLDFFVGCPFGLNCLLRTIIGYGAGLFHRTLNLNGILLPALQGAVATLLKILLLWLITIFFPVGTKTALLFSSSRLFELACNTVLTPVLFAFMSLFNTYILIDTEKVA